MAAYKIGNIEVLDAEHYPEYARLAAPTVAKYGGRYLARGGATEVKVGDTKAHRVVILEFPDLARALAWYDSEEYRPARALRQRYARASIMFVEGAPPA